MTLLTLHGIVCAPTGAMYFRKKTSGGRAYLQIVESRREGAAVRQQVIATLGRVEDLRESGQFELDPGFTTIG